MGGGGMGGDRRQAGGQMGGGGFDQRGGGGPGGGNMRQQQQGYHQGGGGQAGMMMGPPPGVGGGDDRWKQRGPQAGGPGGPQQGGTMGQRGGPGQQNMQQNRGRGGGGSQQQQQEADRWARGQALPPAPGSAVNANAAMMMRKSTLHKAESRYIIGQVVSDDPEEARKQREFKSLLNKVTPDKYETIRDKILAVGIDAPKTLGGLINLVFDKALRDVTFCEIYAALCFDLNAALPEFPAEQPAEGGEAAAEGAAAAQPAITFRRLLISKCQVEFEQGTQAIAAVEAREKQAAADKAAGKKTGDDEEEEEEEEADDGGGDQAKEEGEVAKKEEANGEGEKEEEKDTSSSTAADDDKDKEEGELAETAPAPASASTSTIEQRAAPKFIAVDEAKLAAKAAAAEARAKRLAEAREAQAELDARRRALGNIQFIGQLYRQKMLTEKIMHACITTLLGNVDAPRGEDIECLCKLLATVGRPLDQSTAKTRPLMEVYFQRIEALSKSAALDSRLRFLLKDLIDLRNNQWVERRKKEGPKTIDEIHREARDELARQRAADMRQGPGGDRRGVGGNDRRGSGPPAERRPPRFASEVEAPIRPMTRAGSHEMFGAASSLRPGGAGGAAGGSGAFARVAAGAGLGPRAQPFGRQASPSSSASTLSAASTVDGAAASAAAASAVAAAKAAAAAAKAAAAAAGSEKKADEATAAAAGASPPTAATTPSAASLAASPAPSSTAAGAPSPAEEAARSRAKTLAVEFQTLGSLKEVDATLAELGIASTAAAAAEGGGEGSEAAATATLPEVEAPAASAALVDELFLTAYGLKGLDRAKFQQLVAHVAKASDAARAGVPRAVRLVLDTLEGEAEDAPFAPALVGEASAGFVAEGLLSLEEFAQTLLAAGVEDFEGDEEEDGDGAAEGAEKVLMGSGTTSKVLAATLSALAKRKGADEAKAAWEATGLSLTSFLPKDDREIDALADDLAKDCGLK